MAVKPRKLSQAALETLSVVAYQQPIVKSEIDKIRGVDVAPTLKTLLERKIIKIIGYQASVGQPSLYGTTDDFLRIFGLSSLAELPALRDLRALAAEPGEVGERGENIDVNGAAKEDGAVEEFVTTDKYNDDIVTVREVSNDDETSVSSGAQQITDDHPEVGNT
jgi:segregation and condensation protein B